MNALFSFIFISLYFFLYFLSIVSCSRVCAK